MCATGVTIEELLELQAASDPASWRARSDAAQAVASYLVCHPCVGEVRYPGLKADPDFGRASCVLRGGFGPRVAWRVAGEGAWRVFEAADGDVYGQVMGLEAELSGNVRP